MPSQSQQFSFDPPNPIPDHHDNDDDDDDVRDISFSNRGCCSWIPCLTSRRASSSTGSIWWQRISTSETEHRPPPVTDYCWTRGWRTLREWSELLAGPRWKTFIRTFRKNHNCLGGGGGGGAGARQNKFQYDPSSYALNFDDGQLIDEDFGARDFSSRYAALPVSAKASVDVGKDSRHVHVSVT